MCCPVLAMCSSAQCAHTSSVQDTSPAFPIIFPRACMRCALSVGGGEACPQISLKQNKTPVPLASSTLPTHLVQFCKLSFGHLKATLAYTGGCHSVDAARWLHLPRNHLNGQMWCVFEETCLFCRLNMELEELRGCLGLLLSSVKRAWAVEL